MSATNMFLILFTLSGDAGMLTFQRTRLPLTLPWRLCLLDSQILWYVSKQPTTTWCHHSRMEEDLLQNAKEIWRQEIPYGNFFHFNHCSFLFSFFFFWSRI